ncbi:MAG: hypothetical protein A4S09_03505 [Proteobacteria bacterium SG_bin7]|nr:MAG: hypothetical protein A4S09_03505 [Proteobacteria bacterium SG_bin7]
MKTFLFLIASFVATSALAAEPRMGTYEVPVPDPLRPYAIYHMEIKDDVYTKGPDFFTFPLPESLVGEKRVFKIVRVAGTSTWQGDDVSGVCQTIKEYFRCEVKFRNLNIDKSQVAAKIQAEFPKDQMEKRYEVAMRFVGEPLGIIKVPGSFFERTAEEEKLSNLQITNR